MRCRVYENPDGTVRIVSPAPDLAGPGESEQAVLERVTAEAEQRDPALAGLSFVDMERADLPTDRTRRYAWRVNRVTGVVEVDDRVPRPVDATQRLLTRVEAASTVTGLRDVLRDVVRGTG